MADGAVLELRAEQIVKRGRHSTEGRGILNRSGGGWQIGVALQTQIADFRAGQHARISGAMRLVAGGAAFQAHGCVLEGERSAKISVATETARLVAGVGLRIHLEDAAVGIVAIHAGHGAFREPVFVRPLKLGPHSGVTARAQFVDRRDFAGDEPIRAVRMHRMAGGARHLVARMAALDAAGMRGLIQVALQTNAIGRGSGQMRGIYDGRLFGGIGVLASRAVAGFAGPAFKSTPLLSPYDLVRTLLERVINILVARLAGFRPDVCVSAGGRGRGRGGGLGPRRPAKKD